MTMQKHAVTKAAFASTSVEEGSVGLGVRCRFEIVEEGEGLLEVPARA